MDFNNTNLGRIYLYYDRKFKKSDKTENRDSFMQNCKKQIILNFPNLNVEIN